MNLVEALNKTTGRLKIKRKDWPDHWHARFFVGTGGHRLQVEQLEYGTERDLSFDEWLADDWEVVESDENLDIPFKYEIKYESKF